MMLTWLKSYVKYSYKAIVLWGVVLFAINYLGHDRTSYIFSFFYVALGILREYYHYDDRLEKIKKLKARGLTEEDVVNIEFVKKWEETRAHGIRRYCITDGGIIAGAGLSLFTGLLCFMIFPATFTDMFSGPGKMFRFIGYNYMTGAIIGVISFRVLWHFNERKFIRLTDPLNIGFMSKKSIF